MGDNNNVAPTPMPETSSSRAAVFSSPEVDRWQPLPPMINARAGAGGVHVNDHQFLVLGGISCENDDTLKSCEFYDLLDREWRNLPINMPAKLRYPGVAKIGGRLFVMGGKETRDSDPCRSLFSIDLPHDLKMVEETEWKRLAPMNEARHAFACVSDSRYIYVFGGSDADEDPLDTAERFDIETNKWESLRRMPGGAREHCASGMIGNKIYIVGGLREKEGQPTGSTIVFDTSKQKWESSSSVPDMDAGRFGAFTVVVNHSLIVIGGWHQDDFASIAEVFDTEEKKWKIIAVHMEAERALSAAVFFKERNTIIVAGGVVDGPEIVNTVEMQFAYETGLLPKDGKCIKDIVVVQSGNEPKAFSIRLDSVLGEARPMNLKQEPSTELKPYNPGDTWDEELGVHKKTKTTHEDERKPVRERIANIRGVRDLVMPVKVKLSDKLFDVRHLINEQYTPDDLRKLLGKETTEFDFYRMNGVRISLREEKYTPACSAYTRDWEIKCLEERTWLWQECMSCTGTMESLQKMSLLFISWLITVVAVIILILILA